MQAPREMVVWDLPIRLFHWLLPPLLGFSWWSASQGGLWLRWHFWSGELVLLLVIFRLLWGLAGSETARFASFLRGPLAAFRSLRALVLGQRHLPQPGHNAAGGWAVMAMLLALLCQATTGLFANDDLFNEGPLYAVVSKAASDRLTALHHATARLLLGLVLLHLVAIALHRLRLGEDLLLPMLTGRRHCVGPAPRLRDSRLALFLLIVAACLLGILLWLSPAAFAANMGSRTS